MTTGKLSMVREDAAQHYPIKQATWGFAQPARYKVPVFCLAVDTEKQPSIFPEENKLPHAPSWGLDVWTRGISDDMLLPRSQFSIPDSYDVFTGVIFADFFYSEWEMTEPNIIKIIGRDGDFLDLSIEGFIRHEHASMRPTRITVEARFTKRTSHEGIIATMGGREDLPPHEPPYGATYLPPAT
jgi:hypothetical protein